MAVALPEEAQRAPTHSVRRDILVTGLTQAAVGIGGLLLYRLLGTKKGAEGVAAYSLVKQSVVFAWPLIMVGLQTGIPRYVALGRGRPGAVEGYLLAAVAVTGTTTLAAVGFAVAAPGATASLVFGDAGRTELVLPLILTLVATVGFEVIYGYYRGQSKFVVANVVRVLGVATLPVVLLIAIGGRSIELLISLMAAGLIAGTAIVAAPPIVQSLRQASPRRVATAGRTLLDYGSRRVPGDAAVVVLFSVPTILAAHFVSFQGVGYLSAGLYVLATISIAFQPVGMVFLPLLSRLCADDFDAARRFVAQLTTCAVHVAIFLTPQMILFAAVAVHAWLGPDFADAGTIVAIAVAPAGVFVFNVVLRSALDAAAVTAYNARNNVISLAVATVAATASLTTDLAPPLNCIAWSFALGVFTLGVLTLLSVQRVFRLSIADFALPPALALGALTAAAGWLADATLIHDKASLREVVLILAVELVLAAVYVGGLVRAGVGWPAELRTRFLSRA
jgi:O-antigen/teichoic acid export membrane protein